MVYPVQIISLIVAITACLPWASMAQTDIRSNAFCKTGLPDQPRPTFFSVERYQSGSYRMRNPAGEDVAIRENSSIAVRLRLPVVLRPGLKVLGSFTYYDEDFEFTSRETNSFFSEAFHNKALRSLNASFYIIKPFRSNWFLINRLQTSLSGDFNRDNASTGQYLNYSAASVLGYRKSKNTVLGLGLFYGKDFDGGSLVPLLAYQHAFNNQWSVDALLPVQTALQYYSANKKNVVTATVQLNGPEYNINLNYPATVANQYIFERSEVRWSLSERREIHDWLWLGVDVGVNIPLSTNWQSSNSEPNDSSQYTFDSSLYTMFSLILVPPRKLLDR